MNRNTIWDLLIIAIFAILGVGAFIGVCCGSWHQLFVMLICAVMLYILIKEFKRNKEN